MIRGHRGRLQDMLALERPQRRRLLRQQGQQLGLAEGLLLREGLHLDEHPLRHAQGV